MVYHNNQYDNTRIPLLTKRDEKGAYRIFGAVLFFLKRLYLADHFGLVRVGRILFGRYNEVINNVLKTNE